jgi:hypothetical protein
LNGNNAIHRIKSIAPVKSMRAGDSLIRIERLERAKGIEPSYAAWEAAVLPLNYARGGDCLLSMIFFGKPVPTFPDHASA